MALIDTARAMDDQRFVWRVKAATLIKAKTEYAKASGTNEWRFADHTLRNPMSDEPTMLALAATDPAISEAVVVTEDSLVDTEAVPDTDIQRVVDAMWPHVAKKYSAQVQAGPGA